MKELKDRIMTEGIALGTEILKVDSFLNHQIDVKLMDKIGAEFARIFSDCQIDKVVTVEASGIPVACFAAKHLGNVPVVFAKKHAPNTMVEDSYSAGSRSFTKGTVSMLRISQKFLKEGEKVLIIDDFLAHGQAALALVNIIEQSGAELVGGGFVIEKEFQGGADRLREKGIRVESLAVIKSISDGNIEFA